MNKPSKYPNFTGKKCNSYIISEEDAEVINLAIKLGKPIILEGEPGCGKTTLANSISEEFEAPVHIFPVKSTSKANDLLYRFDALLRLQDSQTKNEERQKKAEYAHNYINLEHLGKAIEQGKKCIILIDEVDKADLDFPDDLLYVLDQFKFPITEIPEDESELAKSSGKYGASVSGPEDGYRPIVIFTSNRSKPLSSPFLRRCFHLSLNFPNSPEILCQIVKANLRERIEREQEIERISEQLITSAVNNFINIRNNLERSSITKKPATAELIDWIHVLHIHAFNEIDIENTKPPFWRLLFKVTDDKHAYDQDN